MDIFYVCSEEGSVCGGTGQGINLILIIFSSTFLRAAVKHKAMPPGPQSLASVNSCSRNQRSEWKTLGVGLISLSREQIP